MPIKDIIKSYCIEAEYKHAVELTDAEEQQLDWYLQSQTTTPQANSINYDIKRAISRYYGLLLLLNGDYEAFVSAQDNPKITRNNFDALAAQARALTPQQIKIIRITCFLTISDQAKRFLDENNYQYPNDSEEFLSWLSRQAITDKKLKNIFPILRDLTPDELVLLHQSFLPQTHFRHMLFTEGANNMVANLSRQIEEKAYTETDFQLWQWRWLTNSMGFLPPAGKYLNQDIYQLTDHIFIALKNLFANRDSNFLDSYLKLRARLAGFDQGPQHEKDYLAHIAAYFHAITIQSPALGAAIKQGYMAFQETNTESDDPAKLYQQWRMQPQAISPTFVPAILNNVYSYLLKNKGAEKNQAIADAVQFLSIILNKLYAHLLNNPQQKISFMQAAQQSNLNPLIEQWLASEKACDVNLAISETGEASLTLNHAPQAVFRA